MQNKKPELGHLGGKFFSYVQTCHLHIVHLGEIQKPLGLSSLQERRLLERLNRIGFVFRLQRGVYIVPEKITAGGFWRPNDYLIVAQYMKLHESQYYLGGLVAFNQHGLSTQVPNQFTVYNDKISGLKKFGGLVVKFIKVAKDHIVGFDSLPIPNHQQTINIANLARTILDAINDWKRYQTLPEAYAWLKKCYTNKEFLQDFIHLTTQCANHNAMRRIGFYLEQLDVDNKLLLPISKKLRPTTAWVPLNPNSNRRGKTIKKWGIINNAE